MKNNHKEKGQVLVEAVIALAVSVLIISGLLSVVTASIGSATFSRNQSSATKYTEEGMELVRSYRDQNTWDVFYGNIGACQDKAGISLHPQTNFDRKVTCISVDSSKVKVTAIVSWTDSKGTHNSKLVSYLTKW